MYYFPTKIVNRCVESRHNDIYSHLSDHIKSLCYPHYLCDGVLYIEIVNIGFSSLDHSLEEQDFYNLMQYNYSALCRKLNKYYLFRNESVGMVEIFENFVRVVLSLNDIWERKV